MDRVHEDRREPSTPDGPLDLAATVDDLLRTAADNAAGRAARTLLPGTGSRLKQTIIALTEGRQLDDHVAPGQATLQVLRGAMTLASEGEEVHLDEGVWATVPSAVHSLHARADSAALLTVVTDS